MRPQVMSDVQAAMNSKDVVALGRALKEAERLNIDEVGVGILRGLYIRARHFFDFVFLAAAFPRPLCGGSVFGAFVCLVSY